MAHAADAMTDALCDLLRGAISRRSCLVMRHGRAWTLKQSLTPARVERHVAGHTRFGAHLAFGERNQLCQLLGIDLDQHDLAKMLAAHDALDAAGVPGLIERSKGKGFHRWSRFERPVEIVKARAVVLRVIEAVDAEWAAKPDGLTPRSAGTEWGSGVFLPWFGGDESPRTRFVDRDGHTDFEHTVTRTSR